MDIFRGFSIHCDNCTDLFSIARHITPHMMVFASTPCSSAHQLFIVPVAFAPLFSTVIRSDWNTDHNGAQKDLKCSSCMCFEQIVPLPWFEFERSQQVWCSSKSSVQYVIPQAAALYHLPWRQPARVTSRKTKVETLWGWVWSIHPTPPGAPCMSFRPNYSFKFSVSRSPTNIEEPIQKVFKLFTSSWSTGSN